MEYSKINSSQILTIHYWNLDLFEDNQKKYLLLANVAFLLPPIMPFANFLFRSEATSFTFLADNAYNY
jgi:hypothetical protein